jgi:hypothetical protein
MRLCLTKIKARLRHMPMISRVVFPWLRYMDCAPSLKENNSHNDDDDDGGLVKPEIIVLISRL